MTLCQINAVAINAAQSAADEPGTETPGDDIAVAVQPLRPVVFGTPVLHSAYDAGVIESLAPVRFGQPRAAFTFPAQSLQPVSFGTPTLVMHAHAQSLRPVRFGTPSAGRLPREPALEQRYGQGRIDRAAGPATARQLQRRDLPRVAHGWAGLMFLLLAFIACLMGAPYWGVFWIFIHVFTKD